MVDEVCKAYQWLEELSEDELRVFIIMYWMMTQNTLKDLVPKDKLLGKSIPEIFSILGEYKKNDKNAINFKDAFDSAMAISEKFLKGKTVNVDKINKVLKRFL